LIIHEPHSKSLGVTIAACEVIFQHQFGIWFALPHLFISKKYRSCFSWHLHLFPTHPNSSSKLCIKIG